MQNSLDDNVAFIVASPRSGTTILGEVLGRHPGVAQWYEPYFIWDWFHGQMDDDYRNEAFATRRVTKFIRNEFQMFLHKSNKSVLVDKWPENSFRIPMVNAIFPKAKYVHLVRDGRDVTLSIKKEWLKRKGIVEGKSFSGLYSITKSMLERHPFWRNRAQAVLYELKNTASLNPLEYLNKSKWNGKPGWGPRFPGWRTALDAHTELEFNATQWMECERHIQRDLKAIPKERRLELRYEAMVEKPVEAITSLLEFLKIDTAVAPEISADIRASSVGKWQREFNEADQHTVQETTRSMLTTLGYI